MRKPGAVITSAGIGGFRDIEFECAVRRGDGLRLHAEAAHNGNLRAGHGRAGWVDDCAFDWAAERQAEKSSNKPERLNVYAF